MLSGPGFLVDGNASVRSGDCRADGRIEECADQQEKARSGAGLGAVMVRELEVDLLLEAGGGGAGRHVLDLYHGLIRMGWNARLILSFRRADQNFTAEVAEIPHERVKVVDMRRSPHPSDIPAYFRLKRYIGDSGRRHLLHAHSTKAGMLGWRLRRAAAGTVFTPHTNRGMDPTLNRGASAALRLVESVVNRSYSKVIAVSPHEERYIASLGVPRARICHIPNGVDPCRIRARIQAAGLRRGQAEPVIGFVGRLVYAKHPMLFLETFRSLVVRGVAARARIVGD